ncbi:MAG: STAS domain-containing protein [Magnetococcales bacterium]|nr:STAS domain-containing protein [Magnetococcales bacterium]
MPEDYKIYIEREGNTIIFFLVGTMNNSASTYFKKLVQEQDKAENYILDFARVSFVGSSFFGAMLYAKDFFDTDYNNFSMVKVSPFINKMFSAVKFETIFKIEP